MNTVAIILWTITAVVYNRAPQCTLFSGQKENKFTNSPVYPF